MKKFCPRHRQLERARKKASTATLQYYSEMVLQASHIMSAKGESELWKLAWSSRSCHTTFHPTPSCESMARLKRADSAAVDWTYARASSSMSICWDAPTTMMETRCPPATSC